MELREFFRCHSKVALAFSGGVDSAYLLYAAKESGGEIRAYYVKTAFQPQFEYADAVRLAGELGVEMVTVELDVLSCGKVTENPVDRCYYCKREIFSAIIAAAKKDGFSLVIDGTNASDDASDRPGMRALQELGVRSPLRECGLTKAEIRRRSQEAGLFTHDKPAYACLATRIPTGTPISREMLFHTEQAEEYLKKLGFSDFRIRLMGDAARIQLQERHLPLLLKFRAEILEELKRYYTAVLLDLEVRHE